MASEDTSLLSTVDNGPNRLDDSDSDVYLRFSTTRKGIILAMVSGCTMINCMFSSVQPDVPRLMYEYYH